MQLSSKIEQRLRNKYGEWAVITGASSGIGFELATLLAKAGFKLLINARNAERLEHAAQTLAQYKCEVRTVAADLSQETGIEQLIHASEGLDVGLLINNAGFGTSGIFSEGDLEQELNLLRLNCLAVVSLTHYFAGRFKLRGKGGMVFLSSLVAFQGVPYAANYAASKAYVQSFAEGVAVELKPYGIDVLSAIPGPVASGFGSRADMKMGNAASPAEVAAPILAAIGRQTNVIPGLRSKVLVYSLSTVPRFVKVKIMQLIMGGFTKHQR